MLTKMADSKGRITLGGKFANRAVIVQEVDETEVRVTLARVIPEREAWLYHNPKAKAQVLEGLAQAKAGQLVQGPDMSKARKLVKHTSQDSE